MIFSNADTLTKEGHGFVGGTDFAKVLQTLRETKTAINTIEFLEPNESSWALIDSAVLACPFPATYDHDELLKSFRYFETVSNEILEHHPSFFAEIWLE